MGGTAETTLPHDSAGSGDEKLGRWERRLPDEPPKAFKAFCLFKAMGLQRSVKGCMELHGVEPGKYGTWSRWARLYDWKERAGEYDEYISKETERLIIAERVERKKRQIEILNEFDGLVEKRVKSLKPEDLDADGAMDLLERSVKLDGVLAGNDGKNDVQSTGQLQLTFASDFKGL